MTIKNTIPITNSFVAIATINNFIFFRFINGNMKYIFFAQGQRYNIQ